MNRDYYNSLSEAYQAINEKIESKAGDAAGGAVKPTLDAVGKAASEVGYAGKAYGKGLLQGKKVGKDDPMTDRVANAAGRTAHTLGGKYYAKAANAVNNAAKTGYNFAKSFADRVGRDYGLKKEEIEALLNSPHLTEEEREAFIAMIDEERKDEAGMSPDQKSIGRSLKAGLNPATDHMAAATRQRLHLSQRGKKKPTAHSKETRLPAQQLKARKANDGVKEMGEEATILHTLMDDLLGENRLTPEALEAAAAATLKKHKEQGYKVHGTGAMDDVIKRIQANKKGQV